MPSRCWWKVSWQRRGLGASLCRDGSRSSWAPVVSSVEAVLAGTINLSCSEVQRWSMLFVTSFSSPSCLQWEISWQCRGRMEALSGASEHCARLEIGVSRVMASGNIDVTRFARVMCCSPKAACRLASRFVTSKCICEVQPMFISRAACDELNIQGAS
jgi:hypothetical protein